MRALFLSFFVLLLVVVSPAWSSNETKYDAIIASRNAAAVNNPIDSFLVLQRELAEANRNADSLQIAHFSSRLGRANFLIGNYTEAIELHQKALEIFQLLYRDTLVANEMWNLGDAYYFSNYGELQKASDFYRNAFKLYNTVGLKNKANYALNNSAYVEWAKGDKEKALELHERALKNFEEMQDLRGIAFTASDLAFTLNSLQRYQEAEPYHMLALDLEKQISDTIMMIPTLANIAKCYIGLGKLTQAEQFAIQSLQLAQARNLALRIKEATDALATIYEQQGKWKDALAMVKLNREMALKLSDSENLKKLKESEFKRELDVFKKVADAKLAQQQAVAEQKLATSNYIRNSMFAFATLLLVFVILIVRNAQKIKQLNAALMDQKSELEDKNVSLEEAIQKLNKATAALIQAEKVTTIGMLAEGLSHEINNPLNFIKASVESLQEEDSEAIKEKLTEVLPYLNEGVDRISKVIKGLNDFNGASRMGLKSNIELVEVLSIVLILIKPLVKNRIGIKTFYNTKNTEITANGGAINQLFANLLFNAIEAIEGEGIIEIYVNENADGRPQVLIKDSGRGIPQNQIDKVFDLYFTTKSGAKHIGLGLSIALNIAHDNNATIALTSQVGVGTEVKVDFKKG